MKQFLLLIIIVSFSACATMNYHSIPPNPALFANKGETQVHGSYGSGGMLARAGYAFTPNFSAMGTYGGSLGATGYHSKEGELALGYNTSAANHHVQFGVSAGYGLGTNFGQDSGVSFKNFRGSFSKPFLLLSIGSCGKRTGVKADPFFAFRINYMMYDGFRASSSGVESVFKPNTVFYEPCFGSSIGGKHVRFEFGTGFSFKNLNEIGKGFRIYPFDLNMGLVVLIGRDYDE